MDLKKTALNDLHLELGARMVSFAGYQMPISYPDGILHEHRHCRSQAALFDISHMGQIRISGTETASELERLTPSRLTNLKPGRQRYTLFTDNSGGILDDLMVTNMTDHLFVVVNAARKAHDEAHLRHALSDQCEITMLSERALLALQGPAAATVMARMAPATEAMRFMTGQMVSMNGIEALVTRCGYTGEDGFEISLPVEQTKDLVHKLLLQPEVAMAGLGARDSLRLEAGLSLYGHDIDQTTTPVEAALQWVIAAAYRKGEGPDAAFPGAATILEQFRSGAARLRVGLTVAGRAPVREGAKLFSLQGEEIGRVTSGGFSPTLNQPIAMGYVDRAHAAEQNPLLAERRDKRCAVTVTALPFVKHRYVRVGHNK